MSFTVGQKTPSITYGKGIYINKGTIAKAWVEYDTKEHEAFNQSQDVGLFIELDHGRDWHKRVYIGHNFRRDDDGNVVGFKGYTLEKLFSDMGVQFTVDDDLKIPKDAVDQLVGREVFFLDYAAYKSKDGKVRTNTYNGLLVQRENEDDAAAAARLWDEFQGDNWGWSKYRPDLYDQQPKAASLVEGEDDDELPF